MNVQLEWILNPLTLYTLLGLALIATLVLFASVKVEIAKSERDCQDAHAAAAAEIGQLRAAVQAMESAPPTHSIAPPGLDLTRRAQALRMHRRGESVATIAAALATPTNEIELLLKVTALQSQRPAA